MSDKTAADMQEANRRIDELASQVAAHEIMLELLTAAHLRRIPEGLRENHANELIAAISNPSLAIPTLAPGDDQSAVWFSDTIVAMRDKFARLVRSALGRVQGE